MLPAAFSSVGGVRGGGGDGEPPKSICLAKALEMGANAIVLLLILLTAIFIVQTMQCYRLGKVQNSLATIRRETVNKIVPSFFANGTICTLCNAAYAADQQLLLQQQEGDFATAGREQPHHRLRQRNATIGSN